MLDEMMKAIFPLEEERKAEGRCPFCGKKIDVENEFQDEISEKEFSISGLCQSCQDDFFQ